MEVSKTVYFDYWNGSVALHCVSAFVQSCLEHVYIACSIYSANIYGLGFLATTYKFS